ISLLHPHLPNFLSSGHLPRRTGNAHPNICPYDTFRTATTPIFLAVGNNGQFAKLCAELGAPELAQDTRYADNSRRREYAEALKLELERLLAPHDCAPLARRLIEAGVPCGPVHDVGEVLAHPHTQHREMIVEIGSYKGTGSPIKLGRTP